MQILQRALLLIAALVALSTFRISPLQAEESAAETDQEHEQIIQQILELRQQMEDLLKSLPEEMLLELEKRWEEQQSEPPTLEPEPDQVQESDPTTPSTGEGSTAVPTETEPVVVVAPDQSPTAEEPISALSPPCGGFHLFDTNEDSLVSGGDRPWRFLRLWFDTDGDGAVSDLEIESLFDLGVRQIDVALRFYNSAAGDSEDVDVDELIWLRGVGKKIGSDRSGVLAIATDRLASDGRWKISDAQQAHLTGYQPLGTNTFLETEQGDRYPVVCQPMD